VAATVSAVIVAYGRPRSTLATVRGVLAQTVAPAEVIVVDNDPRATTAGALGAAGLPGVRVLHPGTNLGYCRACDLAVGAATGEWVFFLNPDAAAEPDCLERLLEAAEPAVGILGAQILLPDGRTINAGDNPVHVTGVSWSGGYGGPREHAPPRDVASVSGAALAIRTSLYRRLGGHCPGFVMYYDDVDLAWRARLAGARVRYVPAAVVRHDYAFSRGDEKWFQLEHNRMWAVLSNYAGRSLVVLAPLLLAGEVAIALQAWRDGWWPAKRRAWRALARELPRVLRWRRRVQAERRVHDAAIVSGFVAAMATPLVERSVAPRADPWVERYRRVAMKVLGG
jgi:N-acetylglucosaminyl-diphospho-decaprenol L-rhamnosyltransferase